MNITLTTAEAHIMDTLMDATDELTSAQITKATGQQMTTARRRKLVAAKLIRAIKIGRAYLHEITDEGAVMVKAARTVADPIEGRIRAAYNTIGARTVKLLDLRTLVTAPRNEFDAALTRMALRGGGVHVRGEADQKTLTEQDRASALMLAGTARHNLVIE